MFMSIMFPSSDINDTSNIYFRYFFHQHFLLRFLGEKRPLTKLELEYWTVLFLHACPGWTYVQMSCHSSYKFYYFLLFFFSNQYAFFDIPVDTLFVILSCFCNRLLGNVIFLYQDYTVEAKSMIF